MAAGSKKFNLTELLSQRSKEIAPQGQGQQDITPERAVIADIFALVPSEGNFYSVEDVQDLKQSIELLGVLQPLLVTEMNEGKWRIIAGHRRRLALMQLVEEGKERFRKVPVMVRPSKNEIIDRLALIMANRFRIKTEWERMTESLETEKLVLELKEQMDIPGRTRDLLAEIISTSPAQLGRYKAIHNNLTTELMEEFKADKIGVSVIYEISGLEETWQQKALKMYKERGVLTLPDVREIKKRQQEEEQIPGQIEIKEMGGEEKVENSIQVDGEREKGEAGIEARNATVEVTEEEAAEREYIIPQPENLVSLCYSCTQYEVCQDKKATVNKCNAYQNRHEAYKTEEQRYGEEQDRIDAETRNELRKRQKEEPMQQVQGERVQEEIRISSDRYKEIESGILSFMLLKKDGFIVGEKRILLEYSDGSPTGRRLGIRILYIWEDWTGLDEDYCIIGIRVSLN